MNLLVYPLTSINLFNLAATSGTDGGPCLMWMIRVAIVLLGFFLFFTLLLLDFKNDFS